MIPFINDKLQMWAEWVVTGRKVVGLGYPSKCAFSRLTPCSSGWQSPIVNDEACMIDRGVTGLDTHLRDVVEQFYLRAGTADTHAKALRICRDTLYTRLHQSHVKIMDWMHDCEGGYEKRLTRSDSFATKHIR